MDENKYPHAYPPYKQVPPHCGVFNRELSHVGDRRREMLDVTMQRIADYLVGFWLPLPLSVVDSTGLEAHFDAVLDFRQNVFPQNPDPSDDLALPPLRLHFRSNSV